MAYHQTVSRGLKVSPAVTVTTHNTIGSTAPLAPLGNINLMEKHMTFDLCLFED